MRLLFLFFIPLMMQSAEIEIVYHIATMGNWEQIAKEQIAMLHASGLGEACDHLTVTIVGSEIRAARALFRTCPFRKKVQIIHASKNLHRYEFPAIERIRLIAEKAPNAKILYLHTKGVTHYRSPTEQNVRLWRQYLEYFAITQWKACVEALESFDLCGVDWIDGAEWLKHPEFHFSGNFWWSRADYLRTCKGTFARHGRWDCEYFIGSGDHPRVKSFHQSGQNLYHFAYLPDYYVQE